MGCGGSKKATNGTPLAPVQLGIQTGTSPTRATRSSTPKRKLFPEALNEDVHCGECLKTWHDKNQRSFYHICTPATDRGYQADRLAHCNACEHNVDGVCLLTKNEAAGRAGVVSVGVKIPFAKCPTNQWDRVMIKCPLCSRSLFDEHGPKSCRYCGWRIGRAIPARGFDILPRDLLVITATDQYMLRGAYMMAWTLLRTNEVRVRCYDLGIDATDSMKAQMESWGVEFVKPPYLIAPENVGGWQTFNKPVYLQHAMATNRYVIWIDADIAVSGSLKDAVAAMKKGFFIPDHRALARLQVSPPFKNENAAEVYAVLGEPKTKWDGLGHPCAGVIGIDNLRDAPVIKEWLRRTVIAMNSNIIEHLTYFDQSILQDILENVTPADGDRWNDLLAMRTGTQHQVLMDAYNRPGTIAHHGGSVKPFATWPAVLNWGHPRGS